MKSYRIAEITLKLEKMPNRYWKSFEIPQIESPVIEIYLDHSDNILAGTKKIHLNQMNYMIVNGTELLLTNSSWTKGKLVYQGDMIKADFLIMQMYYANVVQRKTILLHSSLIAFSEYGFMFLGPSGIGKTTQAELWAKYRDALIINGDAVFVQETEDCFLGWGTPWHGSSPYCENTNVAVHAMIILKQSPENSIRELTGFEKVTAVSNNVFYPTWLENGTELCLEILDHLLTKIPVYELSCRPDEDAVRLTEETIFGKSVI